ncbi:MAG: hypothetical protein ACM336_02475 [Acidobacteriota bacterium]
MRLATWLLAAVALAPLAAQTAIDWQPDVVYGRRAGLGGLAGALQPREARGQSAKVAEVLAKYTRAMGGEAALRQVTSRAFAGSIFIATYGIRGEYREFAAAPDRYLRFIRFPGQAVIQRGFDGTHAWEESPEYGIETLSGERLDQVRRLAVFHPALAWKSLYKQISFKGRESFDGQDAAVLSGVSGGGAEDTLWFDAAGGLLLGIECDETFANGVKQRVRYLFEDYRPLDQVQVPHRIRYESPRMIWVVSRQGRQNVPLEDSQFRPPEQEKP